MEPINHEFLNRIKGRYTEKYATPMDDWTAIILHEVSENISLLSQKNASQLNEGVKEISEASKLISGQINRVEFSNPKEAFFFGLGQNLLYGTSLFMVSIMVFWIYTTHSDFEVKREFINKFPSVEKYESIYREGVTVIEDGHEFLVVYPAEDKNVKFARNYLYDSKKKRVMIPIRTESN